MRFIGDVKDRYQFRYSKNWRSISMPDASTIVFEFVLEQSAHLPIERRLSVQRALQDLLDEPQARQLRAVNDELETAHRRFEQFTFKFKAKATSE